MHLFCEIQVNTYIHDFFAGFLGPWGKYTDDAGSAKPGEEDAAYLEDYLSKMKKRSKKTQEETPMEEKSTLHIKDAYDYQGLCCCFFVCVPIFVCSLNQGDLTLFFPHFQIQY